MPNLSIKNVPEAVVANLRQRAKRNHRSLQGELLDLVCRATEEAADEAGHLSRVEEISGWLSIEEVAAELELSGQGATTSKPLAVDIIRQNRDAR